MGDVYGWHDVCTGADGEDSGGGGAAEFESMAEEAVKAGGVSFCRYFGWGKGDLHSVGPALVVAFDVGIYVPHAGCEYYFPT